jgi:hypothetical protein
MIFKEDKMMKILLSRLMALFLLFSISVVVVSCGDDDDDSTSSSFTLKGAGS